MSDRPPLTLESLRDFLGERYDDIEGCEVSLQTRTLTEDTTDRVEGQCVRVTGPEEYWAEVDIERDRVVEWGFWRDFSMSSITHDNVHVLEDGLLEWVRRPERREAHRAEDSDADGALALTGTRQRWENLLLMTETGGYNPLFRLARSILERPILTRMHWGLGHQTLYFRCRPNDYANREDLPHIAPPYFSDHVHHSGFYVVSYQGNHTEHDLHDACDLLESIIKNVDPVVYDE